MTSTLFTPDFKEDPYWWEAVPRPVPGAEAPLPEAVDVLMKDAEKGANARMTVDLDAQTVTTSDGGITLRGTR